MTQNFRNVQNGTWEKNAHAKHIHVLVVVVVVRGVSRWGRAGARVHVHSIHGQVHRLRYIVSNRAHSSTTAATAVTTTSSSVAMAYYGPTSGNTSRSWKYFCCSNWSKRPWNERTPLTHTYTRLHFRFPLLPLRSLDEAVCLLVSRLWSDVHLEWPSFLLKWQNFRYLVRRCRIKLLLTTRKHLMKTRKHNNVHSHTHRDHWTIGYEQKKRIEENAK